MLAAVAGLGAVAPGWTERMARIEPHPERRLAQDEIRIARALTRPERGGRLLWDARTTAAESGFFWAAAARAEWLGRPADVPFWLGLAAVAQRDPAWMERGDIRRALEEKLK